MSHLKEREEKNCLNCNAQLHGKFCHVCGQENIPPKDSVWHLVSHFFNDITHFDGKFFNTLGLLIKRPGFLTREYSRGRRVSYLNPVRMYIFTSFIFFFISFTLFSADREEDNTKRTYNKGLSQVQIEQMDSAGFNRETSKINADMGKPAVPMTRAEFAAFADSIENRSGFALTASINYRSEEEYDSLLKAGKRHDGWLIRQFVYRVIAVNRKYEFNGHRIAAALMGSVFHSIPQLLFISLPVLALLLKLFYARRKQFFYVDHAIFSVHLYIFVFIALLFIFAADELQVRLHWEIFDWIRGLLYFSLFFYQLKAMRNFYQQNWGKTILKFILLDVVFAFVIAVLFAIFFMLSFLKI